MPHLNLKTKALHGRQAFAFFKIDKKHREHMQQTSEMQPVFLFVHPLLLHIKL